LFYVRAFEQRQGVGGEGNSEKGVDVYLATQIVALAYENAYDVAILISGDSDFIPALDVVHHKGKIVTVVSSTSTLSRELQRSADRVVLIDQKAYFKKFLTVRN